MQGHLSIALTASDVHKSLMFYTDGLGFVEEQRFEDKGKLQGAMLAAGDAHIGISQDDFAKGRDRKKGVGCSFYVETDEDVTKLAKHAKEHGIRLERDPAPLSWGPMGFTVVDPDGFTVTIANRAAK